MVTQTRVSQGPAGRLPASAVEQQGRHSARPPRCGLSTTSTSTSHTAFANALWAGNPLTAVRKIRLARRIVGTETSSAIRDGIGSICSPVGPVCGRI